MLLLFWAWTLHFGACQISQALAAEAPARRQGMKRQVSTCGDNLPLQTSWPHSPPFRAFSGLLAKTSPEDSKGWLKQACSTPLLPLPQHLRVEGLLGKGDQPQVQPPPACTRGGVQVAGNLSVVQGYLK